MANTIGTALPEHLILHLALEHGTIDVRATPVIEAFAKHLNSALSRPRKAFDREAVLVEIESLVQWGFLRKIDPAQREVTEKAAICGQIYRVFGDGMFSLFGSPGDEESWPTLRSALRDFHNELVMLDQELKARLGEHTTPDRLRTLKTAAATLAQLPDFPNEDLSLQSYREAAVIASRGARLRLQMQKEELEVRARDRQVLAGTQREIDHIEAFLAIPDLASARSASKPRITDFVNIGVLEQASTGRPTDEKFGILAAPQSFSTDYTRTTEATFARERPFAVAFIDIDKFKDFNDKYHETVVDRDVLPYFMRALEAFCYGRAIAYRQGGDEYLVLLRNADEQEAKAFFEGLQKYLAECRYPDTVATKPTVSIGVHVIHGAHEVTVFEAQKLANQAKKTAKDAGRNCVRLSSELTKAS